jgi:hypothetical protein
VDVLLMDLRDGGTKKKHVTIKKIKIKPVFLCVFVIGVRLGLQIK